MSKDSLWNKKTISTIAVAWILSFITTLVVVNFMPPIPKNSWHIFEIYEGTFLGSIDEPDFLTYEITIPGDIWRISWHVYNNQTPIPEDVLFYFVISPDTVLPSYPRNHVTKEDFRSDSGEGFETTEEGIEYFFGSGFKYLTIKGVKLDWVVIIEEYY